MDNLSNAKVEKVNRPVRVLQFGEGNFLRAFADYMIDVANEKGVFNGDVIIAKPIPTLGNYETFKKQDNRYTVALRGVVQGKESVEYRVITSIADMALPYEDYPNYAKLASLDTLRFIISNTTEAGIVYDETDRFEFEPPKSYPGKFTKFLYERYKHFNGDLSKGLIVLPVELIENNGTQLKSIVRKLSDLWGLEPEFLQWVEASCIFCNTLVDRIVTGYPKDEAESIWEELGYKDELLVACEPFGLWVIESEQPIEEEFPLHKAGMPVLFTKDMSPYRTRKVRILNGAHTSFSLASYLAGNNYVLESIQDEVVKEFIHKSIFEEIIPTLDLPKEELLSFAAAVKDRFENPYNKHALLSISLNSVSKWKVRVMPSVLEYKERYGTLPNHLTFSLAALIQFYSGYELRDGALVAKRGNEEYSVLDDEAVLEFFHSNSGEETETLVSRVLAREDFWDQNLNDIPGMTEKVTGYLKAIRADGMRNAMKNIEAN